MSRSMQSDVAFIKVKYLNGRKTIHRNADGAFECLCDAKPNGHIYRLSKSLLGHAKTVNATDIDVMAPALPNVLSMQVNTDNNLYSVNTKDFTSFGESEDQVWTKKMVEELISQPIQYGDQIQSNPYMDNFGLVYYRVLQGVLCTHHHILLKSSYIHRHIQDEHARITLF